VYVYLRAALHGTRGNTGVEKEETLLTLRPPTGSRPPVTCSPLILFSLTIPFVFLSPSTLCSSAIRFIFSSSIGLSFCPCALSYRLSQYLFLSHSPYPFSLSSSLVPSFVTMHLVSPRTAAAPICCYCYVVAADETSRCTRIYV